MSSTCSLINSAGRTISGGCCRYWKSSASISLLKISFISESSPISLFSACSGQAAQYQPSRPTHPLDNGNGNLLPPISWKSLEPRWNVVCHCGKCARITCLCLAAMVKCCLFCNCQKTPDNFKNPF